MPIREQIETAIEQIADVTGRRYVEGDGDLCSCWFQPEGGPVGMTVFRGVPEGTPEPFASLPDVAKIELLSTYVGWDGFDYEQEGIVMQNVVVGKGRADWMDGIEATLDAAETHALFTEMMEDTALRKMPEDPASPKSYEEQLQEAADSGRFRTPGKEGLER